jgi:hypothetical protein|tara:strand:- start:2947 stop:3375 length:429 start_codon:yes stop_codon:yes gene_type:complete
MTDVRDVENRHVLSGITEIIKENTLNRDTIKHHEEKMEELEEKIEELEEKIEEQGATIMDLEERDDRCTVEEIDELLKLERVVEIIYEDQFMHHTYGASDYVKGDLPCPDWGGAANTIKDMWGTLLDTYLELYVEAVINKKL